MRISAHFCTLFGISCNNAALDLAKIVRDNLLAKSREPTEDAPSCQRKGSKGMVNSREVR